MWGGGGRVSESDLEQVYHIIAHIYIMVYSNSGLIICAAILHAVDTMSQS